MTLQIADINIFSEQDMKKNIKARLQVSDGNSRIVAMLPDKTHQSLVSKFSVLILLRASLRKNSM